MKFESQLTKAHFIKRYKRFFVDLKLGQEVQTAHLANTGTMKTCIGENWETWISTHNSPTRKLKYSVELISNGQTLIGVNTARTNKLAMEGIKSKVITELSTYTTIKPEVKFGESRIDLFLQSESKSIPDCFVEVKSVTLLCDEGGCTFPDAVSDRGLKHLNELIQIKKTGLRAVLLFVVQREDCHFFNVHQNIDSKYESALRDAIKAGVEILIYQCQISPEEIFIAKKLPIKL